MTNYEMECLDLVKKRVFMEMRQADALERIASALEREPEEIVVTWQDAIQIMKHTCIEADECGPGCPMNEWCQTFNKEGSASAKWEPIENEEAEE